MLSREHIRILELLPAGDLYVAGAPIQCISHVCALAEDVEFEALSYVWGDPSDTATINIDGENVVITKTLEAALKRIRLPERNRTLWVDQLCINQKDENEKASQVPLMQEIFSKTSQCLIWFGELQPDTSLSDARLALDTVQFLSKYERDDSWTSIAPECLASHASLYGPMKCLEKIGANRNAWWTRTWTLQEAVLPPTAMIIWGPLQIHWDTLISASMKWESLASLNGGNPQGSLGKLLSYRYITDSLFSPTNAIIWANRDRKSYYGSLDTIFRCSFRRATNPLDKVYGLLGLISAGTEFQVRTCNYQLPPAILYATFTVDLIRHHRSLQPIAMQCFWNRVQRTKGIAGWALDMGDSDPLYTITIDDEDAGWLLNNTYNEYSACGETQIDWHQLAYDSERSALTLTGNVVDEIVRVGSRPQNDIPETHETSYSAVRKIIQQWYVAAETFYQNQDQDEGAQPQSWDTQSFWRGLLGNLQLDSEYKPMRTAASDDIAQARRFVEGGRWNPSCITIFGTIWTRRMFITKRGLLGFGPHHANIGDQVWILHGGKVPFVVRPGRTDSEHVFVGPSYVHQIMCGEGVDRGKTCIVTLV